MSSKRVLITGAGRGIGLELTRRFVADGHEVWGTARQPSPRALGTIEPAGVLTMDLADEASVISAAEELSSEADGLDLLINCAGLDARAFGARADKRGAFDVDAHTFTEVIRINAIGAMIVTREVLPLLRKGTDPLVLNISSQLGSMEAAASMGNDASYCVSKAALNMWSVKAAAELRPEGIAVVMLHPGWVSSDMGGSAAPMTPTESASAIADTVNGLSVADTGRFIRWDGTDHPW